MRSEWVWLERPEPFPNEPHRLYRPFYYNDSTKCGILNKDNKYYLVFQHPSRGLRWVQRLITDDLCITKCTAHIL